MMLDREGTSTRRSKSKKDPAGYLRCFLTRNYRKYKHRNRSLPVTQTADGKISAICQSATVTITEECRKGITYAVLRDGTGKVRFRLDVSALH